MWTVYRWKDIHLQGRGKPAREPKPHEKKLEEEIKRLKQSNRTLDLDFFKGALQRVKARRQQKSATGTLTQLARRFISKAGESLGSVK